MRKPRKEIAVRLEEMHSWRRRKWRRQSPPAQRLAKSGPEECETALEAKKASWLPADKTTNANELPAAVLNHARAGTNHPQPRCRVRACRSTFALAATGMMATIRGVYLHRCGINRV